MHWLLYKVQHQVLSNRRHVFPGFLLVADRLARFSCFWPGTGTSDLGRRNWGHFSPSSLKTSGFSGNVELSCSTRIVSDLALILLLKNQGVPSLGFWTWAGVRCISMFIFPASTEKGRAGNGAGRFLWSAVSSLTLLLTSLPGWCSYSTIQPPRRTAWGPGAEGLQKQVVGWADLVELMLPSFPALTFAESGHLRSPVLPLGGGMLQSSWVGAPCWGQGLGKGKEEVRGAWDSVADEMGHRGWQQWVCSVHLALQVRLEVAWLVTIPQRQSRSFVLLPSGSDQRPVLHFKCASQDSKDL